MSNASSNPSELPPRPAASVPWNPWWALLLVIVVFYGSQFFAGFLVSVYPFAQHWSYIQTTAWLDSSVNAQFTYIFLTEAFALGAIYLFLRHHKVGLASIGLKKPRGWDIIYALAAVPVYLILYLLTVGLATHLFPGLDIGQKQQIGFNSVHGSLQLSLTFVSLVVLPPIAEEIMIRGFLYSSLKKAMPLVVAVITTSLIFASAHLPEGGAAGPLYIAALDTFVLSLVLIYLREKTGSLWASITLHAIKNGIAFFAIFIAPLLHLF